jgi:hypothetical protein
MKKLILALLPALTLLAACHKQGAATYSGIEAGTLSAGVFTSDNGTVMTVIGNEANYDVSSTRRVLISYQTHPVTDPNRIDIDLTGLLDAGILPPERVDAMSEDPDGTALQVSDAWFSKDYLNILATFEGKEAPKHDFTATYTVDTKGVVIRAHHDGSQDTAAAGSVLSCFLSIPVYEPLLSYEQEAQAQSLKPIYPAPFTLQWTSTTLDGGPLTLYERKGSYTPPSSN